MKKLSLNCMSFFFILCSYQSFLTAATPPPSSAAPAANPSLQIPALSDEQWQMFADLINNMSEEELEFYAKLGEEFINEELKQGRDPYAIFNQLAEQPVAEEPKPIQPVELKPTETVKKEIPNEKKMQEARRFLKNIIEQLEHIQQTAQTNRLSKELLAPWHYHIADLIYFAHKLQEDKLIKHLVSKDFESLFDALLQFSQELDQYVPFFQPSELLREGESEYHVLRIAKGASLKEIQEAYQKRMQENKPEKIKQQLIAQDRKDDIEKALEKASAEREAITRAYSELLSQEQSKQALFNIVESFDGLIYKTKAIEQIKKLFEAYEPEALAIKEEQEKKEAAARKEQEAAIKKRPTQLAPLFDPYSQPVSRQGFIPQESRYGSSTSVPSFPAGFATPQEGIPGLPQAGSKTEVKEPKKETKGKEKEKDKDKDKDKKSKESDKEKKEENKKINDKTAKVELRFKDLTQYIEKGDSENSPKVKDIFKGIGGYLTKPIDDIANPQDPAFAQAKNINESLTKMTLYLNKIKDEMHDLKDFLIFEKRSMKKTYQTLFEKNKKEFFDTNLKDLFDVALDAQNNLMLPDGSTIPVVPEKKYLHMGINEFGADANVDTDETYAALKNANGAKTDFLGNFKRAYQDVIKEFKEEQKPVGVGNAQPPQAAIK